MTLRLATPSLLSEHWWVNKQNIPVQLLNHTLVLDIICQKETPVRVIMMTSSNGNIFRVTGPLCGKFTGHWWIPAQRPVTRRFDVFSDLRLNKQLSKQSWGWWFQTPSCPLLRHCNGIYFRFAIINVCIAIMMIFLYFYSFVRLEETGIGNIQGQSGQKWTNTYNKFTYV